jgi:hypothetical protein
VFSHSGTPLALSFDVKVRFPDPIRVKEPAGRNSVATVLFDMAGSGDE